MTPFDEQLQKVIGQLAYNVATLAAENQMLRQMLAQTQKPVMNVGGSTDTHDSATTTKETTQ